MITYWRNGKGIESCPQWEADCWVRIDQPTQEDRKYLLEELEIPEAFYNDVEDVDERPRIEFEDNWFFILAAVALCFPLAPCLEKLFSRFRGGERIWQILFSLVVIAGFVVSVSFLVSGSNNPFMYANF